MDGWFGSRRTTNKGDEDMAQKKVGQVITRPGRRPSDPPVTIAIAEDLLSVPGIPVRPNEVDFYSREYPLESQNVERSADRQWAMTVLTTQAYEHRKEHETLNAPLIEAARSTGEIEPTGTPDPNLDPAELTEQIREKARGMGFAEVGFTAYNRDYTYASKKRWVRYDHAICLAMEQEYEPTQTIPSMAAEHTHFGTYRVEGKAGLDLADWLRSLGYHAQVHSPNDNSAVYIPMFVEAGLGQLGANGQLLSPYFGSRARLMIITTDAPVKYDAAVDYGIHKFCQVCQVCVQRCPARALMKEKIWYRGAEKNKLIYKRCRPVMARYLGCGICMKVCPIQKFGLPAVMEHYVETGEVLGKGTHNLEGYTLEDKGYFGPGELPTFDPEVFEMPQGRVEDVLFEELKEKLMTDQVSEGPDGDDVLREFAHKVKDYISANDERWAKYGEEA
jgi:ferredoxin